MFKEIFKWCSNIVVKTLKRFPKPLQIIIAVVMLIIIVVVAYFMVIKNQSQINANSALIIGNNNVVNQSLGLDNETLAKALEPVGEDVEKLKDAVRVLPSGRYVIAGGVWGGQPKEINKKLIAAEAAAEDGDFEAALRRLDEADNLNEASRVDDSFYADIDAEVINLIRAVIYFNQRKFSESERIIQAVHEKVFSFRGRGLLEQRYYYMKGFFCYNSQKFGDAIKAFNKVIRINSDGSLTKVAQEAIAMLKELGHY